MKLAPVSRVGKVGQCEFGYCLPNGLRIEVNQAQEGMGHRHSYCKPDWCIGSPPVALLSDWCTIHHGAFMPNSFFPVVNGLTMAMHGNEPQFNGVCGL
jgi:hypothetical protein